MAAVLVRWLRPKRRDTLQNGNLRLCKTGGPRGAARPSWPLRSPQRTAAAPPHQRRTQNRPAVDKTRTAARPRCRGRLARG